MLLSLTTNNLTDNYYFEMHVCHFVRFVRETIVVDYSSNYNK